jgi:hypothetical protein
MKDGAKKMNYSKSQKKRLGVAWRQLLEQAETKPKGGM